MMEGTGKYFLIIIIIFLIVYLTVKICLSFLLKKMKEKSWKAYSPFYTTLVLVQTLQMPQKTFYLTLIPFLRFKYYNQIIKKLLEGFGLPSNDSLEYILIPMYKFPELVVKNPHFRLNEYDLTEKFVDSQKALFEKEPEDLTPEDNNELIQTNNNFTQNIITPNEINDTNNQNNTVWNEGSKPTPQTKEIENHNSFIQNINNDKTNIPKEDTIQNETYIEAKPEKKEEKAIITPINKGKPQICSHCGAKLAPGTTVCFMCGQKLN